MIEAMFWLFVAFALFGIGNSLPKCGSESRDPGGG
jgi:hypothetical protein